MPTALIVDDEPEANRLLSMLVRLRGYETVSAYSGEEALSAVRARHPDVVFLDLMLPDRHGFEVCRSLRADPSSALVPVVVVTARLADRSRAESYEAGATEFVPKPYTPDQIFKALGSASAWTRDLSQTPAEGRIACKTPDRFGLVRQLTGLKSLLLARSPLGAEEVYQIVLKVHALCALAPLASQVACVEYRLDPDRLTLTVLDQDGRLEKAGALVAFDDVETSESGRSLVWTRRFGAGDPDHS